MNGHNPQPGDGSRIERLRVSYIATRIHARLCDEIRHPDAFAELFTRAPVMVQELRLTLPYEINVPSADSRFTSEIAECPSLKTMPDGPLSKKFRRAGIPLRHQCRLEVGASPSPELARLALEARVHPFGIVTIATADLLWSPRVSLAQAQGRVEDLQQAKVTANVARVRIKTILSSAAAEAANALVQKLSNDGNAATSIPDYRIATIIAASVDQDPAAMPAHQGPVHQALHFLSCGGDALTLLDDALVAQWNGNRFVWVPIVLVYMRDEGATTWSVAKAKNLPKRQDERTSTRHRQLVLLLSHITASIGLIDARSDPRSQYFDSWAKDAANRMGRLYGPAMKQMKPGLEARAFLQHIPRAIRDIECVKGCKLTEVTPAPPYPPQPQDGG